MVKEFREFWDGIPHKAAFGVLLGAWVLLFHFFGNAVFGYTNTPSLWTWLNTIYENAAHAGPEQGNTADDAIGRWIPLLVLALAWIKRKELLEAPKQPWAPALAILVLGIGMHLVGYIVQQTRVSVVGCIVGGYGLIGTIWGPAFLRAVFFPYCILLFAIPMAAIMPTSHLQLIVASIATDACHWLLNIPVAHKGTIIYSTAGKFYLGVAPACSGIRSLTVVALLATCFAFLNLKSWWRRLFVIGMAVPMAVLGNVLRVFIVIIVGDAYGQERAAAVETKLGFLTFLFALGSVFLLGKLLDESRRFNLQLPKAKESASAPGTE